MTKRKELTKRYGIRQEKMDKFGLCWRYKIRVLESDGKLRIKAASGFASKAEADVAVSKLKLDSRARQHGIEIVKPLPATAIHDAVEGYIRALQARWRAKHGQAYVDRNKGQINPLRRWVEFAGANRPVKELTKDDLMFWVEHEAGRGVSLSAAKRRVNNVRAALNHARDVKPDLVSFRVPKSPLGKEADVGRIRLLTPDEIKALAATLAADPDWRDAHDFFRVALGTGGRIDEIVPTVIRESQESTGLRWEKIEWHDGAVWIYSHKVDKWRRLVVPGVIEILKQRKQDGCGTDVHAFAFRDHWLRKVLKEASAACEIPWGRKARGGWAAHDLRHTCLSHLLHSGVDLATVRDFAGHESISETTRYVHATDHSRRLAAEASSALIALASADCRITQK